MIETITKYWTTWVCGGIAATLVLCRKKVMSKLQERKKRQAALEYADRYVLFQKLKEIYCESVAQGYVTVEDLAEAEETYQHYHDLGGNGKATVKIEALRDMEVRPD